MKFLFITAGGDGLALATIVKREGHRVTVIDTSMTQVYEGMLEVIRRRALSRISLDLTLRTVCPDVVVFCKHHSWGAYVKSLGVPVLCGGDVVKVLNKDKLPSLLCDVEGEGRRVGFWWNGSKSFAHFTGKIYKRMMNEDLGAECECSGSIVERTTRRALHMTDGVIPLLRKTEYRGPVCADIVDGKVKRYRLGLDLDMMYALLELCKDDIGELIFACASGFENSGQWYMGKGISIRMTEPHYPCVETSQNGAVWHIIEKASRHIHLQSVARDGQNYTTIGNHVGCVTARGINSAEARRRVLRALQSMDIPELQYRTDIGRNYAFI